MKYVRAVVMVSTSKAVISNTEEYAVSIHSLNFIFNLIQTCILLGSGLLCQHYNGLLKVLSIMLT